MSKLEEKILSSLEGIGYKTPLLQKSNLSDAIEGGPKSVEFTKLVNFLTTELRTLNGIDEEVNEISSPEDSVSFIMEVTSFLKELNCPYRNLTEGHVSERLQHRSDRLLLLDYLLTELMSARILREKKPGKKIELKLQETPEGKDVRLILQTLRFPKPPGNISISTLFQKLVPTIPMVLNRAGRDIVGNGIFNGYLSSEQWGVLEGVQEDLHKEYKIRREMMLARLDVTIQSFQWSEKTKGKENIFEMAYKDKRKTLKAEPDVDITDLLAARTDIAINEKTSSSSVRKNTKTSVNKVIIGQVPDRGGRTSEITPPAPEMPSWQQRSAPPCNPNRGGGNYKRGGANYDRGGGNFDRGGGNFDRGGGNFDRGGSNFDRGGGNFDRGGGNYDRGNANYMPTERDFNDQRAGSGNYRSRGGNYRGRGGDYRTGSGPAAYGDDRSFDGAGNYGNYSGGTGNYGEYRAESGRSGYGDGNYGSQDYQQTKRAKTFDSFQANKSSYAEQYVEEREQNMRYQSGGGRRGGGRYNNNYRRGGRGRF